MLALTSEEYLMARDPVCGMEVDESLLTAEHNGETFAFCSTTCHEAFAADPSAYLTEAEPGEDEPVAAPAEEPGLAHLAVGVEGMHCASCAKRIEEALERLDGVAAASVNFGAGRAHLTIDPARFEPQKAREAIQAIGYDLTSERTTLAIEGMSCASCVAKIERAMMAQPGVLKAEVNLATNLARVDYFPGVVERSDLLSAVERAGYSAEPIGEEDKDPLERQREGACHLGGLRGQD